MKRSRCSQSAVGVPAGLHVFRARVAELADAPHSKCGIERCVGSSPTSGTVDPLVRGDFALTCVQSLWWRPSDAKFAGCGLAAAVAYSGVWVAGSGSWLVGAPPACGWVYAGSSFRFSGLVGDGQHLFMVRGCGHNMTSPTSVRNSFDGLFLDGELIHICWVSPAKVCVDNVHT